MAFQLDPLQHQFVVGILMSIIAGVIIGIEREFRGKSAGIATHSFVIGGSMLFTLVSIAIDPGSPGRVAANIVVGIGFLGAGMILKADSVHIVNLTTAASIWFSAAIGMAIGMQMYFIAVIAALFAVFVPRIPQVHHEQPHL
jgi:putative Mg2+ transporter-C (MgtC) family protein